MNLCVAYLPSILSEGSCIISLLIAFRAVHLSLGKPGVRISYLHRVYSVMCQGFLVAGAPPHTAGALLDFFTPSPQILNASLFWTLKEKDKKKKGYWIFSDI